MFRPYGILFASPVPHLTILSPSIWFFGFCAIRLEQMPFRETHHISGRAVALAESRKVQLHQLSVQDYKDLCDKFGDDVHEVFNFEASVERRNAIGGTSREMVERQVSVLRKALAGTN